MSDLSLILKYFYKKSSMMSKINTPNTPNSKVVTEDERDSVSEKDRKTMLADDKADAKEIGKPKEYSIDTFKRPLSKDEKEVFNKLNKDEQKTFIIKRWIDENRTLDKSDMHEISLDDEKEAGLLPS